jgi:Tol biopolymer transport system component
MLLLIGGDPAKNMKKLKLVFAITLMFITPLSMLAINTIDTRMLTQPAIIADRIAFIYAEDLCHRPFRDFSSNWSFDSKWIAFSKVTATQYKRIYLYNSDQKKSYPLTN